MTGRLIRCHPPTRMRDFSFFFFLEINFFFSCIELVCGLESLESFLLLLQWSFVAFPSSGGLKRRQRVCVRRERGSERASERLPVGMFTQRNGIFATLIVSAPVLCTYRPREAGVGSSRLGPGATVRCYPCETPHSQDSLVQKTSFHELINADGDGKKLCFSSRGY